MNEGTGGVCGAQTVASAQRTTCEERGDDTSVNHTHALCSPIDLSSLKDNMASTGELLIKMAFLINNLYTYKVINALFHMLRPLLYCQRSVRLLLAL